MGLFWIENTAYTNSFIISLNPRFDGAFLNLIDTEVLEEILQS